MARRNSPVRMQRSMTVSNISSSGVPPLSKKSCSTDSAASASRRRAYSASSAPYASRGGGRPAASPHNSHTLSIGALLSFFCLGETLHFRCQTIHSAAASA